MVNEPIGSGVSGASGALGTVDPARFARDRSRVTGTLVPQQLPRVLEELFDEKGGIGYDVAGYVSDSGAPCLRIHLTIDLAARCQRCLDRLPLHFEVERNVVLVDGAQATEQADDDDPDHENDDIDTIPLTRALDLKDLVEEEIVLSLPMAPRHPESECAGRSDQASERSDSPFAALSGLKVH